MENDPEPTFRVSGHAVVSTSAPNELREFLVSCRSKARSLSDIAVSAVNIQLDNWRRSEKTKEENKDTLFSLFGVDFSKVYNEGRLGENVTTGYDAILLTLRGNDDHLDTRIWTWTKLPYTLRCVGMQKFPLAEDARSEGGPAKKRTRVVGENDLVADTDEWILRNEASLRLLPKTGVNASYWKYGLIKLQDIGLVFPTHEVITDGNKTICVKVPRPNTSLPGFTVLENKRRPAVYLQPDAEAFRERWHSMTDHLLEGLNWANVFVAGGTAFGALVTPSIPSNHVDAGSVQKQEEWKNSDIDLYIYGLNPELANEKIQHIADVYRRNLPDQAPFLVVRNSQTITLYSQYPIKRLQIVLKLVNDPRDVLLNFDLDICAVGFDGTEAWILPRCARALETGLNVFTMDLVAGHYLGDRKCSRETRVFKYANKGYGLRFLPSYLAYLNTFTSAKQASKIARGENLLDVSKSPSSQGKEVPVLYSLATLKDQAAAWTKECVDLYIKLEYQRLCMLSKSIPPKATTKHVFSHAMLETYKQMSSETLSRRSCLNGFSLFMRHVALWEEEAAGNIMIDDSTWAETRYEESRAELAYNDTPKYEWDADFDIEKFKQSIDDANNHERNYFLEGFNRQCENSDVCDQDLSGVARTTYGSSIGEILSPAKDIVIPLALGKTLVEFANCLTLEALADKDQTGTNNPLRVLRGGGKEIPVLWRLNRVLNWQMLDRRIDEVREVLWALHRANERSGTMLEEEVSRDLLLTEISRRAIRVTVEDEMNAFVRWIGRRPTHEETKIDPHYALEEQIRFSQYYGEGGEDGGVY